MAATFNKFISNAEATPTVDSDLFEDNLDSRFAIGVFNSDDILNYKPDSLAQSYLHLRANVYIDQTGFLDEKARRFDGTELDIDDERSTHFVVFENRIGRVATIACMRLVVKDNDLDHKLPVENFFPEAFPVPSPRNSLEVSRFIVRHDDAVCARSVKEELITTGLAHTLTNNLGPILGIVETNLERDLRLMRLPVKRLSQLKLLPQYNTENLAIEIDKSGLTNRIGEEAVKRMTIPVGSFGYWGEVYPETQELS